MNITCSNPNCRMPIKIPEGAQSVTCPSCDMWHFTSDYDTFGANPTPVESDSEYNLPPTPADYEAPSDYQTYESAPFPGNEPKVPPAVGNDPYGQSPADKATPPQVEIGYLMITSTRQQYQLKSGRNTIGREGTDLIINDAAISRQHCVIEVTPQFSGGGWEYTIYDHGHLGGKASTNGVFIHERSLRIETKERIPITSGTVIKLGNVHLVLYCS